MTQPVLAQLFSVNRRYARSINLERDFDLPNSVLGYVPTERSVEALRRIGAALTKTQSTRAWTLTGVYGTGKSAFAHYLTALCAPAKDPMRSSALEIAQQALTPESAVYGALAALPQQGLFRAVVVGQREPLRCTIVRALERGADAFWVKGRKPEIVRQITDWAAEVEVERPSFTSRQVLAAVQEMAEAAKTDLLLLIDELGKNLEFAAHNPASDDLYLLQQLAELPRQPHQVYVIGLLHQSFADYSQRLASAEKNEWAKIQGRFEDIPFTESTEQMTRLIGQAIDASQAAPYEALIYQQAESWRDSLRAATDLAELPTAVLAATYPLHPVAAIALPMLCTRYAQNDRSLFTFLTSAEPHAFASFLATARVKGQEIPTLKLHHLYDYFVESIGSGLGSRPNLQRWLEIQGLVADAKHLDADSLAVLKTIGILNLITATGALRATRSLVKLALINQPNAPQRHWDKVLAQLIAKGLITHRKQLDELRLWEGSDFDVEQEIATYLEKAQTPLATLLALVSPLKPLIAQRHSYRTGTLRYFERQYLDQTVLENLRCTESSCDGLVGYWLGPNPPAQVPEFTQTGQPLILLTAANLNVLKIRAMEFAALQKIQASAIQLQTDGVARREVRHRLVQAKRLLDEALNQTFNLADEGTLCWIGGRPEPISHSTDFNAKLSQLCDRVYPQTPILWNELINRRELTSQGAKARRELIEAMLERSDQVRLGLEGYGPEVAIYYSVLAESGIHASLQQEQQANREGQDWGFQPPLPNAGVGTVWQAIETFCLEAKDQVQPLDQLYRHLEAPPYGVKQGVIPVLLAAVLIYHGDDVSVYRDGSFIPVLSSEHFELLVKDPSRYGVKSVEVAGLRAQVFRELESILRTGQAKPSKLRNTTLLSVVKPLFQFVRRLPAYTLKTKRLSRSAQAVLQTLLQAQEPDVLLFQALPVACGLPPIGNQQGEDGKTAKTLRQKLVQALQEIQNAYDNLLSECQMLLHSAFGVRDQERLREDLRVRSGYLLDHCIDPLLRRFTLAAVEASRSDREWIEAIVMIVADKPAESWSDEEATAFELKLSDLARRFRNLEALRTEVAASQQQGFEVRRVTITAADGQEVHRMVWLDHDKRDRVERLVEQMLESLDLYDDAQLQQAIAARLAERVLGAASEADQNLSRLPLRGRKGNAKETIKGSAKEKANDKKNGTSQANSRTLRRQG